MHRLGGRTCTLCVRSGRLGELPRPGHVLAVCVNWRYASSLPLGLRCRLRRPWFLRPTALRFFRLHSLGTPATHLLIRSRRRPNLDAVNLPRHGCPAMGALPRGARPVRALSSATDDCVGRQGVLAAAQPWHVIEEVPLDSTRSIAGVAGVEPWRVQLCELVLRGVQCLRGQAYSATPT